MVDLERVCCMCGDLGFPDKLFRCNKCLNRFQHSYCSNYYSEHGKEPIEMCDWCRSEEKRSSGRHGGSSKKPYRSEYSSADRIKQRDRHENNLVVPAAAAAADKGKNSGSPSPRPTTRRYKLLKDVMC